jgi:hypothetical protein
MNEIGHFYKAQDRAIGTHLALRWNGRVRFTVPCETRGQQACWQVFRPGRLELPLRAMALLPGIAGAANCVESEQLAFIRKAIGTEMGLSCCRAGAPGPWSKDTILFLDKKTHNPLYIVKAGTGEAVDSLLRNEANWLRTLRDKAQLSECIPTLIAHRCGADLSFVVESLLPGKVIYRLGNPQITFLQKLHEHTRQTIPFQESRLYQNLCLRLKELRGLLTKAWEARLDKGMMQLEQSFSRTPILLVAAHNDFTPWNIRVEHGVARVFDWEYADDEQLPLFDPLHFVLMPLTVRRKPAAKMIHSDMCKTMQLCRQWLGKESCYEAQSQALAYLMNLCTHYLLSVHGKYKFHPILDSYAESIDYLFLL